MYLLDLISNSDIVSLFEHLIHVILPSAYCDVDALNLSFIYTYNILLWTLLFVHIV